MMQTFDNSINAHNTESHLLLENDANDSQLDNTIKICDESEQEDNINDTNNNVQESVNEKDTNKYHVYKDDSEKRVLMIIK